MWGARRPVFFRAGVLMWDEQATLVSGGDIAREAAGETSGGF